MLTASMVIVTANRTETPCEKNRIVKLSANTALAKSANDEQPAATTPAGN